MVFLIECFILGIFIICVFILIFGICVIIKDSVNLFKRTNGDGGRNRTLGYKYQKLLSLREIEIKYLGGLNIKEVSEILKELKPEEFI